MVAFVCAPASAGERFDFTVYLNPAGGSLGVGGLDDRVSARIDVASPGGQERYSAELDDPGNVFYSPNIAAITAGDLVTVSQPADAVDPSEVYVIPAPRISAAPGQLEVELPAGHSGEASTDGSCERAGESFDALQAGTQTMTLAAFFPGMFMTLIDHGPAGDTTVLSVRAPGESPCFSATLGSDAIGVGHLSGSPIDSARLLLKRGGVVLAQQDGYGGGVYFDAGTALQPGDVLEVEQPAGGSVTGSVTIPAVTASYDPESSLVTVDAPAAGALRVSPAIGHGVNFRFARNLPAGVMSFDFAQPDALFGPLDLAAASAVEVRFVDPDHALMLSLPASRIDPPPADPSGLPGAADGAATGAAPGVAAAAAPDRLAPRLALRKPSRSSLRLTTLRRRGLDVRVSCSERSSYELRLTAASGSRGKRVTIGRARGKLASGTQKLHLTLGRAWQRKLKRALSQRRTARVRLELLATDAAGNSRSTAISLSVVN